MFEQMSRNRFWSIRNNLHLIDNLEIPQGNRDKFIKVRPIFDALKIDVNKFQLKSLLVSMMVPFTGKLDVKQYVKGKPTPYGIKIYCLSGKSGILYDFTIYQGQNTSLTQIFYPNSVSYLLFVAACTKKPAWRASIFILW